MQAQSKLTPNGRVDLASLVPHPEHPCEQVERIECDLSWSGCPHDAIGRVQRDLSSRRELRVQYRLEGDTSDLNIPSPGFVREGEDLWKSTCFELFIRKPGEESYREFNFSPSGEWAMYSFFRYRQRMISRIEGQPGITVAQRPGRLVVAVSIPFSMLWEVGDDGPLEVAISAVLENKSGVQYFWSSHHAGDAPDFHHSDSFTVTIAPPH